MERNHILQRLYLYKLNGYKIEFDRDAPYEVLIEIYSTITNKIREEAIYNKKRADIITLLLVSDIDHSIDHSKILALLENNISNQELESLLIKN